MLQTIGNVITYGLFFVSLLVAVPALIRALYKEIPAIMKVFRWIAVVILGIFAVVELFLLAICILLFFVYTERTDLNSRILPIVFYSLRSLACIILLCVLLLWGKPREKIKQIFQRTVRIAGFTSVIIAMVILSHAAMLALASVRYGIADMIKKKDWVGTTATITFIGTPYGDVYGSFTDERGVFHENVYMYRDGRFMSIRAAIKGEAPEPYIGTEVKIIYDPSSPDGSMKIEEYTDTRLGTYGVIVRIWESALCIGAIWLMAMFMADRAAKDTTIKKSPLRSS